MLPFHCFGEELKGGGCWHFLLAQCGRQGGLLPQQGSQPASSSDLPCDPEQVLSWTLSAHSWAES